jgi:hypothetical protein
LDFTNRDGEEFSASYFPNPISSYQKLTTSYQFGALYEFDVKRDLSISVGLSVIQGNTEEKVMNASNEFYSLEETFTERLILHFRSGIYKNHLLARRFNIRIGFETGIGKNLKQETKRVNESKNLLENTAKTTVYFYEYPKSNIQLDNGVDLQLVYKTKKDFRWVLSLKNSIVSELRFKTAQNDTDYKRHEFLFSPRLLFQIPL